MNHDAYGYGLWGMVVLNSAIFLIFAFSFYHPKTKRNLRPFGAFSAFIVALFTEMYMVFIFSGFILLSAAWTVLYRAQRTHELAVTGPYAYIRHPQYAAFILIMVGFLLQWPTLLMLVMFPILVVVYVKLAHREELEVRTEFGNAYEQYAAVTPGFIPRWHWQTYRHAH